MAIVGTKTPTEGVRRQKRSVAKSFSVPRQIPRTSGDCAHFLCDNAEYVFGLQTTAGEAKRRPASKLRQRRDLFRARVAECADRTGDEGIHAVSEFLDEIASGGTGPQLPDECASNDLFAFVYAPDVDVLVHDRPAVRSYWRDARAQESPANGALRCLLSDAAIADAPKFGLIKKVPGGTTSGIALVSFNEAASESYGWAGNENAPLSRDVAEACNTALNRLVDPDPFVGGRRRSRRSLIVSGDTLVCYWSDMTEADDTLDVLSTALQGEDPERVGDLLRSLWRGVPVDVGNPAAFYALTLSGAKGRAIIRDWFVSTVGSVSRHLAAHFRDLAIVPMRSPPEGGSLPPQLPLKVLLASLAPPGRDGNAPPNLAARFVSAGLRGGSYPQAILARAVERTRAECAGLNDGGLDGWRARERQDARSGLIKALLRRNHGIELGETMDTANVNPGYLLGRLFAVIERIQQAALGDVNASVVDRYFAGASASPRSVFVRLLRNARHHVRKAQDDPKTAGMARWLDRQVDEIAAPFDPGANGFPAHLSLEQQALFVLGYHQQRHALWQPRKDSESASAASTSTDI